MYKLDFIAKLKFVSTEEGGRRTPVHSGYRPHIEFESYPEYLTSGQQTYINKEIVFPGDEVKADIGIMGTEYFAGRLYTGMKFKFCEGARTIGYGEIIDIINSDLKISSIKDKSNINLYPVDITTKFQTLFGTDKYKIISEFQELIILSDEYRNPRLIRAMIHLIIKEKYKRSVLYEQVKTDLRDIFLWAEYDKKGNRIRDFNNEFGKEIIKQHSILSKFLLFFKSKSNKSKYYTSRK